MENESSIKDMIRDSLEQIRTVIDADTIVGRQIVTPDGTVIIPISKLSMGFATGGLDLPSKNGKGFGGGGGTGVSVSPIGFLTVSPDGNVKMIPMTPVEETPIEQAAKFVSQIPDIVSRIKDIFGNGESASKEDSAAIEKQYEEKLAEDLASEVSVAVEEEEAPEEEDVPLSWKERRRLRKLEKEAKRNEKEGKVTDNTIGSGTL